MKKHLLFLFAALLPMLASAQTKVEIDGIWYYLYSEAKQAIVTYKGSSYDSYTNEYSGSIILPATVTYEGVDYSVTSIGERAFYDCTSLTTITLPEGVTSIGELAFEHCTNLTTITLPESVTSIEQGAFFFCSSLTSITLPEGVTSIGSSAFNYCSSLTSITLPEGVTSIGDFAFNQCSSLTTITLPEGVTSIGEWAFVNCSSLTAITIPESVTSIGDYAFKGCSSLTAVTFSKDSKLTSIGNCTFSGCSSLITITLPESLTSIGQYSFEHCSSLTSITLPESVTRIGAIAFYGCSSLTAITLPEGMTSIGNNSFDGCSSLTAITLPKNLKNIYSEAFANCSELLDVYCYAEEVPSTYSDAFDGSYPEYITLHVPASALNAYKSTAPWSSFGTIVAIEDAEPMEKCSTPTISYVDGKVIFACDTEGATIISETNETTERIAGKYESAEFALTPTYTITAYATKENYEDSDIVTATLCWIACDEEHEEGMGIINIPSKAVLISTQGGTITVSGLTAGTEVAVYSTAGTLLATATATDDTATLSTDLATGDIAIVKIGKHSIKVAIK